MFKLPSTIAQDLLLIQDLVSAPELPGIKKEGVPPRASSIDSSGTSSVNETDSEEEDVVETLLVKADPAADEASAISLAPTVSSSESSESDSESESESDSEPHTVLGKHARVTMDDEDDEDDGEALAKATAVVALRTKNEIPEPSIISPDIAEVGVDEPVEKVGEVMSVIDNVVIVKGLASQIEHRASERALDSESLLVFEDRKVLGYVHETFGPTYQPFYQVRFPSAASIDLEIVKISRTVFHVPPRSNFVFPNQLRRFKGSDASNVHDEEIGEDEAEFSDDEAEAAYKRQRERQRGARRESSVGSSRFSTPTPSQMHDQELVDEPFLGASPYDEYGPYDTDTAPGPSRPTPLPYDDPYQEDVSIVPEPLSLPSRPGVSDDRKYSGHDYPRGRGRGRGRERGRGRGRGERLSGRGGYDRGPGRGRAGRGGSFASSSDRPRQESSSRGQRGNPPATASVPRPLSPTSLAIARATGQLANGSMFTNPQAQASGSALQAPPPGDTYQQNQWYGQYGAAPQNFHNPQYQQYVQPHINPRFASAFGIDMNFIQSQQYTPYQPVAQSPVMSQYGAQSGWDGQNFPGPDAHAFPGPLGEFVVQTKPDAE